jgi:hypothetical protein
VRGVRRVVSTVTSMLSRQEGDSIASVDHDGQLALGDAAREPAAENVRLRVLHPEDRG